MLKKLGKNKKGFTLAELLIVVAIIAVLVAIAIPTFTRALSKAQTAAEQANARALHAEMVVEYLETRNAPTNNTFTDENGVKYTWAIDNGDTTATVTLTGYSGDNGSYTFALTMGGTSLAPPP